MELIDQFLYKAAVKGKKPETVNRETTVDYQVTNVLVDTSRLLVSCVSLSLGKRRLIVLSN